ncbi:hypothetical protein GGR58DRAFT_526092 [Xylaria digitata]|nr:hypothetical protein GGR58DRAFT_526092 [Xylaria digitata]
MDAFTQNLQKYTQSSLKSNPSSLPEILAIFLGGSRLYKQQASKQSDYDSVVIMSTKQEIYSLLNDRRRRHAFAAMIGIEQEEFGDLEVPSPTSPLWSEFDAVRFAGHGANSDMRLVKILNLVDICQKEATNLLTFKERRVFETGRLGARFLCVQTTTLPNGLKIQHDQWVYTTAPSHVAFGYIADLLLSSACVYDKDKHCHNIKKVVAERYFSKSGTYPTLKSFCRNSSFPPTYSNWFSRELTGLFAPFQENASFSSPQWQVFLGENCSTKTLISLGNTSPSAKQISDKTLRQFNDGKITRLQNETSILSFNSISYKARTDDGVEIFVKETPFAKEEKHGAELALRFFPRIMNPRIAVKGELVYPFFRGTTKTDVRLSYIRSGYKDRDLAQRLLHVEMVQAEDTLRAYRQSLSLTDGSVHSAGTLPRYNIQRFFHDRLIDDSRMKSFYGQGMKLPGVERPIPFDKLLALRWRINGQRYTSLKDAFDYARSIVAPGSPYLQASPIAFGLGDFHGGNVMMSDEFRKKGGSSEVLFIDFEVSGFHPVMLDLAKPLYFDTMFESLFRKILGDGFNNGTRCHVAGSEIVVDLAPRVDALKRAILRIKTQYLIKPLSAEVQRLGGNLEDHVPILAVALFLCATVSRNFSDDPIDFAEKFALGFIFLRARNWDDIDACFRELGFR